jgi:bla regulator protein BlaR1
MTNFIIELLLPLSLLLSLLLIARKSIIKYLGVNVSYKLWGLFPLGLVCYLLPLPWLQMDIVTSSQIQRYIINPVEGLRQPLHANWLMWTWFVCTISLMVFWLLSHLRFANKLLLIPLDNSFLQTQASTKLIVFTCAHT